MEELGGSVGDMLVLAGIVFLPSQLLILRYSLWRQRGRKTALWSIPLTLGWVLFLVGIAGGVLDATIVWGDALFAICTVISIVCIWIATPLHWLQGF